MSIKRNPQYALFADRAFLKNLIRVTLPIMFQQLMLASVAASDALMLGNIDQNSMSAVSLATQIQFVQNMFTSSIVSAGCILGAQYWGKKDTDTVSNIFCLLLRSCGVVALAFFAGCMFFPRELMLIFTNEEALIAIGIPYLRIAGWSYLITGISQCYLALMKVSDHVTFTAMISSGAVVMNIVLNAVFIYGLAGVPELGVEGAALATLIARVLELIACIVFSFKKGFLRPRYSRIFARMGLLTNDFYKCLLPLLGSYLLWGVGFTSYSSFMGHMGADAAAASSVTAVIRDLVCSATDGLAGGAGIVVGNALGAGKLEEGKTAGIRIAKLAFLVGAGSALLMLLLKPLLIDVIQLTDQARYYLNGMMLIVSFYMIGRAANTIIINGVLYAGGDAVFDLYSLAVTMWGIAVPLAAAGTFLFHWPVFIVYACTCLDEVGKIPWVLVHFRKYKWVNNLTR